MKKNLLADARRSSFNLCIQNLSGTESMLRIDSQGKFVPSLLIQKNEVGGYAS